MRRPILLVIVLLIAVVIMAVAFVRLFPRLAQNQPGSPPLPAAVEPDAEAIEANNRGVGLMGRYDYSEAHDIFSSLVEQYPDWTQARINLAIATLNRQEQGDEENALAMLDTVLEAHPDNLQAQYVSGLLRLYLDEPQRAAEHFRFVADRDEDDAFAAYYVGQTYSQQGDYEQALQWYDRALELDPYLRSVYYARFQVLQRLDQPEQAASMLEAFQQLDANPRAHTADFVYTKMGPKALAATVGDASEPAQQPDGPIFLPLESLEIDAGDAQPQWREQPIGGSDVQIHAVMLNDDAQLDLFITDILRGPGEARNAVLLGNPSGGFTLDLQHPLAGIDGVLAAAWGDLDNDGRVDAYLLRRGGDQLWMQGDEDKWEDRTAEADVGSAEHAAVDAMMIDADHDGDLDILVAYWDRPVELFNNNRNGTFRRLGSEQNLLQDAHATAQLLATDLTGDRVLDLMAINTQPPHQAQRNDRLWTYRPAQGMEELLQSAIRAVVAGDVDADGRSELFVLHDDGSVQRWSQEDAQQWRSTKLMTLPDDDRPAAGGRMALADVTGNGRNELLVSGRNTVRVLSLGEFAGEEIDSFELPVSETWTLANVDANGPSLVTVDESGMPQILKPGPGRFEFALLSFTGREDAGQSMRSNASGIGTYYAARIGTSWTAGMHIRDHSGPGQNVQGVAIGMGGAAAIDFLQLDWTDGVLQTEIELQANEHHVIAETQRQLSSCPVLWAWDGEKFEFVSDILGVGGIGFMAGGPGEYAPSRPWENFLLPENLLQQRAGSYALVLGEPMQEACYLDAVSLVEYHLPPGWSMTLDERMPINDPQPTGEPRFYQQSMLPVLAVNDRGDDVRNALREVDRKAAPVGEVDQRFIGRLVQDNAITLTFDQPLDAQPGQPMLVADGWVEYPYSQTAFAAWQAGAAYRAPTIEARGVDGSWQPVLVEFGYPAGMPRQMSVPLDDLPAGTTSLRISTNQEVYWDRLMIAWAQSPPEELEVRRLPLAEAELRRSGFARRIDAPQRLPYYDHADRAPLWDTRHQAGWYTRFGAVQRLVREANQALAIFGPGEEILMHFTASDSEPRDGWTRRHVLESRGWCKDMDLFTEQGQTLSPLPGHDTPARKQLHEAYNTRFEAGR